MIDQIAGNKAVINRVEDLRHNATTRIYDIQEAKVPSFGNLELYPRFKYRYDGTEYEIRDMKFQCYMAKNLPFIHKSNEKMEIFIDSMINCISNRLMYPFILFVQGKFIPWTNIIVIKDYFYSYILVSGYENFNIFDDYCSIYFHCYVKYGENSLLYKYNTNPAFYFDNTGVLTLDTDGLIGRVEVIDKNVIGKDFKVSDERPFFIVETDKIPINLESIIVFKNNKPFKEGLLRIVDKGANVFEYKKLPEDDYSLNDILIRVYYNKKSNISYSNTYLDDLVLPEVQNDIVTEILSGGETTYEYLEYIRKVFDFDHIRTLTYDKNINNSIKYILEYNSSLFDDTMEIMTTIDTVTYYGRELIKMIRDDGYLYEFRRNNKVWLDTYVMIFHNNKLLETYNTIEYETNKFKVFIGKDIKEDDVFEFLFFNFVNNHAVEVKISDDHILNTAPIYDLKDCDLYSRNVENPVYDLYSEKDHLQYKVEFEYTDNGDYNNTVTLKDTWFYNRPLSLSSRRQFRYCWNNITSDRLTITLSPEFKFCHDIKHYMVFVNGLKLDPDQLERLSNPEEDLAFDELCLYTKNILHVGDIVEVFYLPEIFTINAVSSKLEINHEIGEYLDLDFNADYSLAENLLDKYTVFLYINGLKINPLVTTSLGNGKVRINIKTDTITSINIMEYLEPIDILNDIEIEEDLRTKLFKAIGNRTKVLKDLRTIEAETDIRKYDTNTKAVVYEMVHNFYNVDGVVNKETNEFNYSYTTEVLDTFDIDENGNYIIRATDSIIEDKAAIYNTTEDEEDDFPSYNYEKEGKIYG